MKKFSTNQILASVLALMLLGLAGICLAIYSYFPASGSFEKTSLGLWFKDYITAPENYLPLLFTVVLLVFLFIYVKKSFRYRSIKFRAR